MLPDIQPGNTKILYFFNCLLDGMHTTGNTPRVHILITIEITIRYSFLNINRISKLSNYLSVKYIRNILDIPQFPSIVHFSSRNKRENCYLIY